MTEIPEDTFALSHKRRCPWEITVAYRFEPRTHFTKHSEVHGVKRERCSDRCRNSCQFDRQTETDRDIQRQTETDRDRQRQTETDRDRDRQRQRQDADRD